MNLNASRQTLEDSKPIRYRIDKAQGSQPAFKLRVSTLINGLVVSAVLVATAVGAFYVALGVALPDAFLLSSKVQQAASIQGNQNQKYKSSQEGVQALLDNYVHAWNAGSVESLFERGGQAGENTPVSFPGDTHSQGRLDSPRDGTKIEQYRLDGLVVATSERAYADATFLTSAEPEALTWWRGEQFFPAEDKSARLSTEHIVRYAFSLVNSGSGWRIRKQTQLQNVSTRVKASDDPVEAIALPELSSIAPARLTLPQIQQAADTIVQQFGNKVPEGAKSNGGLTYSFSDKEKVDAVVYQQRCYAFREKVRGLTVTSTAEAIASTGPTTSVFLLRWRAEFSTNDLDKYTATWRELYTMDRGASYPITAIERLDQSPILTHYGF